MQYPLLEQILQTDRQQFGATKKRVRATWPSGAMKSPSLSPDKWNQRVVAAFPFLREKRHETFDHDRPFARDREPATRQCGPWRAFVPATRALRKPSLRQNRHVALVLAPRFRRALRRWQFGKKPQEDQFEIRAWHPGTKTKTARPKDAPFSLDPPKLWNTPYPAALSARRNGLKERPMPRRIHEPDLVHPKDDSATSLRAGLVLLALVLIGGLMYFTKDRVPAIAERPGAPVSQPSTTGSAPSR
jgi:hypothetical protein